MDIYVDLERFNQIKNEGFDPALGYWFWNQAVLIAPMATGNLRSAIFLARNKPKSIKISYSLFKANYAKFLEEGQGPVKKYKDFIKKDTVGAITEQLVSWIITGYRPSFAIRGIKPFIQTAKSDKPFSKERALLKQADMNTQSITAKTRSKISQIRETQYQKKQGRTYGERPTINAGKKNRIYNKNISQLHSIYKERLREIN